MSSLDPFTPASPVPVDPDDALADLEADFQQTTTPPEVIVVQEEPPPIGKSWAFDFTRSRFRAMPSARGPLQTNDLATLIQWAEKCLHTSRGAHPIHPPGYGLRDRNTLLGGAVSGAPVAELEGRIREALTFHPRIAGIHDFDYDYDPADEWISIEFTMVLDDDTLVPIDLSLMTTTTQEV